MLSLSDLAVLLNVAINSPGANGFTTATSGLSSSTFGIRATNDGSSGRIGVVAGGNPTPLAAMPTAGTATYNGATIGAAASSSAAYALAGNAQLVANFSTNTVNTTLSNLQFENTATNVVTAQPNLTGAATITGNQYKAPYPAAHCPARPPARSTVRPRRKPPVSGESQAVALPRSAATAPKSRPAPARHLSRSPNWLLAFTLLFTPVHAASAQPKPSRCRLAGQRSPDHRARADRSRRMGRCDPLPRTRHARRPQQPRTLVPARPCTKWQRQRTGSG